MQEVGRVGWDPISVNHHLPWASKLLILYLLVVVATSIVKSTAVLRLLWSLSHNPVRVSREYVWEMCSNKIRSLRQLVFVTLLLTVLVTTMLVRASLMQIAVKEVVGIAAFSGGVAEVLTVFVLGILVCTVIYAVCALYEGVLSRRRSVWNQSTATTRDRQPKG